MTIDKKIKYKDKKLTAKEKKKIKPANQGGGPNYLGKQETVTVPKKWLSDPDHVVAELAYITPKEQKILLDANIYGSLKGKPNKGPGGIMSLQGDLGGYDASPGGPDSGGPGGNRVGQADKNKQRAADIMTGRVNVSSPTGVTEGYTGPEGVKDSFGNYVGGKYVGNTGFLGNLLSGANRYGYRDVYTSGPNQGDVKPGYAGRFFGGLASLLTGIPFVGSALGSMYDKGKGIFNKDPYADMSAYNRLGLFGEDPDDIDEEEKISETSFTEFDPNNINNQRGILTTDRFTDSRTNFGLNDTDGS
jgi:hypothetical protein